MKNTIKILILILIISFQFTLGISLHVQAEGEIEIYTIEDLDEVRNNLTGSYILMNDLDFADPDDWEIDGPYGGKTFEEWKQSDWNGGTGWGSIGRNCKEPFKGIFDGQGYTIRNLYINKPQGEVSNEGKVGLFGVNEGTIKNINVLDFEVTGIHAGGLVGSNLGTITDSFSAGFENGVYKESNLAGIESKGSITVTPTESNIEVDNEGDNEMEWGEIIKYITIGMVITIIMVIVINKKK